MSQKTPLTEAYAWIVTREELAAWLDAIYERPFGPLEPQPGDEETATAMVGLNVARRCWADAPDLRKAQDLHAWGRELLRQAALAGKLDDVAAGVLRWCVLCVRRVVDNILKEWEEEAGRPYAPAVAVPVDGKAERHA